MTGPAVRVLYAGREVDRGELVGVRPIDQWHSAVVIRSVLAGGWPQTYVTGEVCRVETVAPEGVAR